MPKTSHFILAILLIALPLSALAATWPGSSTATNIGSTLMASVPTFEPSGIVWHSGRGTYIAVSDAGQIAELSSTGAIVNAWSPSGNWEGVTVADTSSSYIYLAHENNSAIYEFDLSTGALTGKTWSISTYIYPVGKAGFEALTWVPDGDHAYGTTASGGVFYAGWQYDGDIYIFEPNLSSSGTISHEGKISTHNGYTDLSDLDYNHDTDTLIAVYDGYDAMELYAGDGTYTSGHSYTIPASAAWEGVTFVENCPTSTSGTIALGDDDGSLSTYGSFPASCVIVDADSDGVYSDVDCNDADSTVSSNQTYYLDADGDGKGSTTTTSVCSSSAPAGYVTNKTDCNDADATVAAYKTFYVDADGDGVGSTTTASLCAVATPAGYSTTSTDCSDTNARISANQTYYKDGDLDGYGDPATTTSVCSTSAPAGYVGNASDTLYPNNRIEICNDGVDNDGDSLKDEANDISMNGPHPIFSAYSASASGYITSALPMPYSIARITYTDGSCYDYRLFADWISSGYVLKATAGTSYYTATRGTQTATLNGLTGAVTTAGSYPSAIASPTKATVTKKF